MVKVKDIEHRNSIRIAILGKVSCGKSTLLNGIFVKKYADMKMKRTTMLPFVYKETNKEIYKNHLSDELYKENVEMNSKIYTQELVLTNENCKEILNMVPCIENFVDLPDNIFLDLYDIPGLDDGQTQDIYFKWVQDNFYKFDIIIHVVDINSALNTAGETKILDVITDCIKLEKEQNERDIPLFTLINKCDDMNYNPDTKQFEFDDELKEMYDQILNITETNLKSKGMHYVKHSFSPFSAIDTYIYRMLDNNPNVDLDMKLLNKFGQNELGRTKWNRATDKFKKDFIKQHFSDCNIDETLELTGYQQFKGDINNYLTKHFQYKILTDRLKYELKQESILSKNISKNVDDMKELIKLYNDYSTKIKLIDKTYLSHVKKEKGWEKTSNKHLILDIIIKHIENWIMNISDLSNESEESVSRLSEYKEVFALLNDNILKESLSFKIKLSIDSANTDKWFRTTGLSDKVELDNISTLSELFESIKKGYSKLQNNYYINKLNTMETYNNFPEDVFSNLSKLQTNDYDNIEKTISDINDYILTNLRQLSFHVNMVEKPIYQGFMSNTKENNILIQYCEKLMNEYDYPKENITGFIHTYMLNRYKVIMSGKIGTENTNHIMFPSNTDDNVSIFGSYTCLLDAWLCDLSSTKTISNNWKNLFIINKSYTNLTRLDPFLYYCKDDILALPIYLKELENINDNESDMSDYEDVKEIRQFIDGIGIENDME